MARLLVALLLLIATTSIGHAGDESWGLKLRTHLGLHPPPESATLERVAQSIRLLPEPTEEVFLAAEAGPEGHWRFVNRAGETISAATEEELARAISGLLPGGMPGTPRRLTIHLTEDSVFQPGADWERLPADARLMLHVGGRNGPLLRSGKRGDWHHVLELNPGLRIALTTRAEFEEMLAQLSRPWVRDAPRIVMLEAGQWTLALQPAVRGAPLAPVKMDPDQLRNSMGLFRLGGIVLAGRVEGKRLVYQGSSGPERGLLIDDLADAAREWDVDLLIVGAASARQPGTRNWLWQRTDVAGLDAALQSGTLGNFLASLAGDDNVMVLSLTPGAQGSVRITARPFKRSGASSSPLSEVLSELSATITGQAAPLVIEAHLASASRRRELALRLVPVLPATVQLAYLAFLLAGLVGCRAAWRWWVRIWPVEATDEYATRFGWLAAMSVRGMLFGTIFLPIAGVPAGLAAIGSALVRGSRSPPAQFRSPAH